ncbi:T6SS immunity protein Tli4 family protein [Massilia endophytica]|uniref:T6SS immunity protein Tli4 family protein n=1 Tax=Massilia endophytica TaxID=2899220 RepID=UPI001E30B056|nr:T6SS immunity protein Tli4 family protein [Massilia endophytica]UGQ48200.1 hypothetical protein LSQ66_06965 [Massilia endophytica]
MEQSTERVQEVFKTTRTLCVGRFLIDVPLTATVVHGAMWVPYDLIRLPKEAPNIDEHIQKLISELDGKRHLAARELRGERGVLGKVVDGALPGQRIFFGLSGMASFYKIRSLIPIADDLFIQTAIPVRDGNDYGSTVQELNSVARRIVSRGDNELPRESGFCVDGALVRDSDNPKVEKIQMGIRLKEFPDVHFSLELLRGDYIVESDAIEPRLAAARRDAIAAGFGDWFERIKTLRRGERTLGAWKGFEVLARLPAQKDQGESHDFNFVALGEAKNPSVPALDMKLDTGVEDNRPGAIPPSISDAEAVYLWDKLTNSLRLRPVTASK